MRYTYHIKQLFLLVACFSSVSYAIEQPFVIIIASYNNSSWYKKNLSSIFSQTYDNYRVVYIDDCSLDGTGGWVERYILDQEQSARVRLIRNAQRRGHLANQYAAINVCQDNEIIIILDGDDWFAHDGVLAYINSIYQDPNVWLTYGQFKELSDGAIGYCAAIPYEIVASQKIRLYRPWVFGHVRTFYAGLFKRIKKEDVLYNNQFFPMAADVATMIPMAEMAGKHMRFINDILYIHNDLNPLNLKKVWHMQAFYELVIRRRKAYAPLISLWP